MMNLTQESETSRASKEELYLSLIDKDRRACEASYYGFFQKAWKALEPATSLIDNWHIKFLCDLAEKEVRRIALNEKKTKDYIINISPRTLKSSILTIYLCPWAWTQWPWLKFINASYESSLSIGHCLESRRLIESEWYQSRWGDVFTLTTDQNQKKWFQNDKKGMRKAASTRGSITGHGADVIVEDDPEDPKGSASDAEIAAVRDFHGKTLYSRLNNQEVGIRFLVQQRLSESDLTGYLLNSDSDEYYHYCIPSEVTEDIKPKELKKHYKDGLFFPDHPSFTWSAITKAKLPTNLGPYGYSGQYLQAPAPPEGGTFKRVWWVFWKKPQDTPPPVHFRDETGREKMSKTIDLPPDFEQVIDSWDLADAGELKSDDVAGGKWGKNGAFKFLLNQYKDKMDYPTQKKKIKELYDSNKNTSTCVIEKASNAAAVESELKSIIPGLLTIPTGRLSKVDRVHIADSTPYAAQAQAGQIILPHPKYAPWVLEFIEEHAKFPKVAQDAQVDQSSQAVNFLSTTEYVFPMYQPHNVLHYNSFELPPVGRNYAAAVLTPDLKIHIITALWSQSRLYVYGALTAQTLNPDSIVKTLIAGMQLNRYPCSGFLGNTEMFSKEKRSVADTLNREFGLFSKKNGIKNSLYIRPPDRYEKMGSINITQILFSNSIVTIHPAAVALSKQISGWYIHKGKESDGFPLAEAFLLLASEINRTVNIKTLVTKPTDYTEKYTKDKVEPQKTKSDALFFRG